METEMRVLVTAASRHGSTSDIARAIGDGLRARGLDVELRPIDAVDTLDGYDAVILSSAIYLGRWLRPAVEFAHINAAALDGVPVWLFSSGPVGRSPGGENPEPAGIAELVGLLDARDHRLFAGRLDRGRLGIAERAVLRLVRGSYEDDRDWRAIDEFAGEITASLDNAHATAAA